MVEHDIPYAYELFNRITNSATVNGEPLGAILVDGRHNLWHCFAQSAFIDECARFSETKRFEPAPSGLRLSYFLLGGLAFLVSLATYAWALIMRPRAFVYSVDNVSAPGAVDFRIERVYKELRSNRVRYLEVVHTVIGHQFLAGLWKRRRPAVYLEGLEWAWRFFRRPRAVSVGGLEHFTEDERRFAEVLVAKFVGVAPLLTFRTRFLARLMRDSGAQVVLAIDDARNYHDVVMAARDAGIRSYAFQHAHVTPYHPGWLKGVAYCGEYPRSDYLVVWNDYWKSEMIALDAVWPAENLVVGGSPKKESARALSYAPDGVVLVPYETHAPRSVVSELIRALKDTGAQVVLKARPDVPEKEQRAAVGDMIAVYAGQPVSCVVGTYSTYLSDAVAAGIPVGVVRTPLKFAKHLIDNRLAEPMSLSDMPAALKKLMALSPEERDRRRAILAASPRFNDTLRSILVEAGAVG